MSDIEPGLENAQSDDDAPPVPIREGLPPRYRMRADAHYVEQLDSTLFKSPVRQVDVRSIDPLHKDSGEGPSTAFIESIRRHGVLQPLLVRSRAGRFQVMAGSKRLAAALEVGLREVPCLVERLDDDEARAVAAATNVPSSPREGVQVRAERPRVEPAFGAFAECLTAVASSAGLLSSGSTLTQTVAVDLIRAEAARALQLLRALQVLNGELTPKRRTVLPSAVVQRVLEQTASERRLRGMALSITREGRDCPVLPADEDLLVAAVGALVVAAGVLLDADPGPSVTLGASLKADGAVAFVAEHEGAELPLFWRSILAEDSVRESALPGGRESMAALTLLRAARQVAELHEGRMSVDCADGSTSLSILLPAR
jgi:ParB-like chromosome segregation protein Spo0J